MNKYTLNTPKTWNQTMRDITDCMKLWGISQWDILVSHAPRSARRTEYSESERLVTLVYTKDGKEIRLPMNKQKRPEDNLRALFLCIDSMRMNEKRGVGELVQSAYLQQLGAGEPQFDPYQELGIYPDQGLEIAEAVYRSMASKYHPDASPSGDVEKFKRITRAIEMIRKEVEKKMKKQIFNINFDTKCEKVSEAMGVESEVYSRMGKSLERYFSEYADENDTKGITLIDVLSEYLESKTFKKTGYRLDKPADYLMLGMAFDRVLNHGGVSPMRLGGGINPSDLLHLLAHLAEE